MVRFNKGNIIRLIMMSAGVLLMGVSVTLFAKSSFGTDPYSAMNMGISSLLGMPFGVVQLMVNAALLILMLLFARHLIGIGTIVNMVAVGFMVDLFSGWFDACFPKAEGLALRLGLMIAGIILLSLAASLYFTAGLGVAPYDGVGFILTERAKINFRWCRIATDLSCVTAGFFLGSVIGVGTVITALFMGPLVQLFTVRVSTKILKCVGCMEE